MIMKIRTIRSSALVAIVIGLVALAPGLARLDAQFQTSPTTFSGRAAAVSGTILGVPIGLVDTGPITPDGGSLESHLLCYPAGSGCAIDVPDLTGGAVSGQVLNATVVAQGNHSKAAASVADLTLNAAGQSISADVVQARAEAECASGSAFIRTESQIAQLVVNGQTIAVTGDVNQRVVLPGGGVVLINEQVASVAGKDGDITVNALHIKIPGLLPGMDTDVIVAQAHADIHCGERFCPADKDFVTGGGWLGSPKKNFAVAGGIKSGAYWGHLLYIDHAPSGMRVKGTGVTAYMMTGDTTRHIEGLCEVNGNACTYTADVDDQGEPGVRDTFSLKVNGAPVVSGRLDGGNIQLHTCK
jgi:hypothetical protein